MAIDMEPSPQRRVAVEEEVVGSKLQKVLGRELHKKCRMNGKLLGYGA